MIKLKLYYKTKTANWFLLLGLILALASTLMGIISFVNEDYKYGTFSFLIGALLLFTVYKGYKNKDPNKTQEVEVEKYEEIRQIGPAANR